MLGVRGEIDQISTNTYKYTTCCAANIYIFIYILIGAHIAPLTSKQVTGTKIRDVFFMKMGESQNVLSLVTLQSSGT